MEGGNMIKHKDVYSTLELLAMQDKSKVYGTTILQSNKIDYQQSSMNEHAMIDAVENDAYDFMYETIWEEIFRDNRKLNRTQT